MLIPYVYAEARDFIFEHHKLGHDVAIITASAASWWTPSHASSRRTT